MTSSIKLSQQAYTTVLLHCAKYPASAVTGVLLGSTAGASTMVHTAIPLQHHWNQLSPMIEVALSLVQAHVSAQSQSPQLQVVGVYYAPSDVASSAKAEINPTALKVAQTIATKLGGEAIALQVNNAKLGQQETDGGLALYPFSVSSTQTKSLPTTSVTSDDAAVVKARAAIVNGSWKQLVDFDDHLEDTSRDWLHPISA